MSYFLHNYYNIKFYENQIVSPTQRYFDGQPAITSHLPCQLVGEHSQPLPQWGNSSCFSGSHQHFYWTALLRTVRGLHPQRVIQDFWLGLSVTQFNVLLGHHGVQTERFELPTPCLQGTRSPIRAMTPYIQFNFTFDRLLINYSITSFCFDRSEAQYEEKPNHGFHISDSQLPMWIISLLTYADIFLSFSMDIHVTTWVRKHTLRNLPNAYYFGK